MPVYKIKKPTKDGRSWYFKVNYKDDNGKYHSTTRSMFSTKKEALEEEAKFIINMNKFIKSSNKTINDLVKEYLIYQETRIKKQTFYNLEKKFNRYILPTLGKYKLNELNFKTIEEFKSNLPGGPTHKNNVLKVLKALNNWNYKIYDEKNSIFDKIDLFKVTNKKEMEIFTIDEFNKFINKIDKLNYKALFYILFYCGLRIGEAQALTWNDIDNDSIKVTKSLTTRIKGIFWNFDTPKTNSSTRTIPMPNSVKNAINEWYNYVSKCVGFKKTWFLLSDDEPLRNTTITNIKNKACEDAKIKQIRLHDFRHSCASLLINNGANITLVSKYLGHSDIKMTLNTYSHFYENELKEVIKTINNL